MGSYEIVINALKAKSSKEDERLYSIHIKKSTISERLRLVNYLNSIVYDFSEDEPPRVDRTAFRMRKQGQE